MARLIAITIDKLGAHRPLPGAPINGYEINVTIAVNGAQKTSGTGIVWSDQQAVLDWMGSPSDEMWQELSETLVKFIFWRWRAVNPAMDNPALLRGRTVTFDLDTFGTISS